MGTRSLIGKEDGNGITAIYCHWDGYPEHNGALLREFYNDNAIVEKLISLGDISSLGKYIDVKEELKDKKIMIVDKTLPKGKSEEFVQIKVEDGTYTFSFFEKEGVPMTSPYDEETPVIITGKLFDFQLEMERIKTQVEFLTMNTAEAMDYLSELNSCLSDMTIAYHRDRGEGLNMHQYGDERDYLLRGKEMGAEYLYLWKNGEWWYADAYDSQQFELLRI